MNSNTIIWKSFDRDLIPLALFGEIENLNIQDSDESRPTIPQGKVAIGFANTNNDNSYTPPALLVLNENSSSEILSWLRVYSPDTSPVSQFTRVLTYNDWTLLSKPSSTLIQKPARTDQWSCVILGELLAQSDMYTEISSIPLSRVHACFSSAVSHTSSIYNSKEITNACVDRLKALESDRRFVTRILTLSDLSTIWDLLESFKPQSNTTEESSIFNILDSINRPNNKNQSDHTYYTPNLDNFPDLNSNSIEARVIAFNNLLNEIYDAPEKAKQNKITSATIAAAAFLVGRSTSHMFLLRRISKDFPSSFAWFGLFAAVCGASAWDSEWARATKGIERNLRTKFDWSNPALVDLCWAEYSWLSQTPNSKSVFSDIPKLSPRVLSIEVVPGATCQLLLVEGLTSSNAKNKKYTSNHVLQEVQKAPETLATRELRSTIEKFIELAARAKESLSNTANQEIPTQESFNLEHPTSLSKPSRVKRTTKINRDNEQ